MPPNVDGTEILGSINFVINGQNYSVSSKVPPTLTLVNYIRDVAKLTGTKVLCYEGGCGACTVVVTNYDQETNSLKTYSVKSCQTLVYTCDGWSIETIEHLGSRFKGYHSLQKAVAGFYGTQCGYCTPGFIMTMYGQLKSRGSLTKEIVEKSLDGNLCRCTGYRPILDAFKSLAIDAPAELKTNLVDIEEAYKAKCPKSGEECSGSCKNSQNGCGSSSSENLARGTTLNELEINVDSIMWYKPSTVDGLYKIIQKIKPNDKYRLVNGNTAEGVYKNKEQYKVYIDITGIKELHNVQIANPIVIGANVSLTRCIEVFKEAAKSNPGYSYLLEIAKHWENVANTAIRNMGSWSGNLFLKNQRKEFPSDLFVTLCAANTSLQVGQADSAIVKEMLLEDFINEDLSRSVIISMKIPVQEDVYFRSYKISQRNVNTHAYINAAFKFKVNIADNFKVLEKPTIVYGGVRHNFVHALATEQFLINRKLGFGSTIEGACTNLKKELKPDTTFTEASAAYRISLCQSLLYKAVLDLVGTNADVEYRSGGSIITRAISSGKQSFDRNEENWPIGKAIPKLESNFQVSGEAEYTNDIPSFPGELHGAFVQTTVAKATIDKIDTTEAMRVPGVVAFITAKDIPGINNIMPGKFDDPIFVTTEVGYAGQAVGLIVAKERDAALRAAELVNVTYTNIRKPILTIKEALKTRGIVQNKTTDTVVNNIGTESGVNAAHSIKGILEIGSQYHFAMEPHATIVVPKEEGFDVYTTTQHVDSTQSTLAQILGMNANKFNLSVRRIGGAFGGRISRANLVAGATAAASLKLQKPVRVALPIDAYMTLVGWREPYYSKYKATFDNDGRLGNVEVKFVSDAGHVPNEVSVQYASMKIPNVYYANQWTLSPQIVTTDTAANTWCRTPGTVEAIATMENIIEHVATVLKMDPLAIRELNFVTDAKKNNNLGPRGENTVATKIFPMIKEEINYAQKRAEVDTFNTENRWKKRGLAIMPNVYLYDYPPFRYTVHVAIYQHDGTVVISHGGIEMGQGINTKVAQVAAKTLNIPIELVQIKPTNNFVGANSSVTGGSFGSDLCAHGVLICCQKLRERINVIENEMEANDKVKPEWPVLIKQCQNSDVDLSERYWTAAKDHPKGYDIFGATAVEVEVDVLTGQFSILKTNVIEDTGRSLSPYVDIGQVEGSIIMGFGLYTCEEVKYNPENGQKLSNGTWEYKIPTALDIPIDFRVSFLPGGNNITGVVGSKATGEPAVCMGYAIVMALRDAIKSARADAGDTAWFDMHTPLTVEKIQQLCKVQPSQFRIKTNEVRVEQEDQYEIVEKESDVGCSVN